MTAFPRIAAGMAQRLTRPGFIAGLVLALGLAGYGRDRFDQWIDVTPLPALAVATSVQVLDRKGQLLRAYTVADGRWRLAVEPSAVDPGFTEMLITYEDRRFWSHSGIDPWALVRAAGQAVTQGRVVSGGSTLTMQVARLLEDSGTGQMDGKFRQMRLALALERRLAKNQILGLYLQLAPYGGNLEGIRAASLSYFGKEPLRLTPAQRALLVAIPQSPAARRPDRHPAAASDARDRVLARALAFDLIDADILAAARREAIPVVRIPFPNLAAHLADRVVAADPAQLTHRLTIDKTLQTAFEALARDSLTGHSDRLQVAILLADHQTGEILASVGSQAYEADRRAGFIDMTQAMRSPGSTLKPLIYGLAFDQGLAHPETMIDDRPSDFGGYRPQNFDRQYRGTVRIRDALQLSLNIPVVALTEALGPPRLMAALDNAGITHSLPPGQPGLAVALGGIGVTLEGMVGLYASIARGGVARPLTHLLNTDSPAGQRVMSPVAAFYVGDILSGLAPPPGAPENRLAYKTGTSYGHRDAWAIGFDGAHVIGVWMGRPDGTPVPGAFGAETAAPVLFQAFARVTPALTPLPQPPAAALMLANGQLPQPLRQFRSRSAAFEAAPDAPDIAFPPDGAEVEELPEGLLARVAGGKPPFIWLANGRPVASASPIRDQMIEGLGKGFVTLTVLDAEGRSARVRVRLR
jgi:penicillin-binding protein 1C